MRIQIVFHADLLCPWSFVGKRSLETAMYRYKMQHPNIEFEVIWKPFLLYPGLQYIDKRELYIQIMGTEKLRTFIDGVQAAGVRHGVDFSVHGATGPSQRGHRLVALALQTLGPMAQGAVVESIFRGHFEHGMDIADAKWLMSVGSGVGLEPQAVLNALDCQAMGQMLNDELTAAATSGVIAVPSVLIGARFRVAGYQAPELFEGAFDRLRKEREQGLAAMNQAMRCDRLGRGGLGIIMEDVGPNGGWTGPAQGNQAPDIQGTVPDEGGQELSGQALGPYRLIRPAPAPGRQKPSLDRGQPRSSAQSPGPNRLRRPAPEPARQESAFIRVDPASSRQGPDPNTPNRPGPAPVPPRQVPAPAPAPVRQGPTPVSASQGPAPHGVYPQPVRQGRELDMEIWGLSRDDVTTGPSRGNPEPSRQDPSLTGGNPRSLKRGRELDREIWGLDREATPEKRAGGGPTGKWREAA